MAIIFACWYTQYVILWPPLPHPPQTLTTPIRTFQSARMFSLFFSCTFFFFAPIPVQFHYPIKQCSVYATPPVILQGTDAMIAERWVHVVWCVVCSVWCTMWWGVLWCVVWRWVVWYGDVRSWWYLWWYVCYLVWCHVCGVMQCDAYDCGVLCVIWLVRAMWCLAWCGWCDAFDAMCDISSVSCDLCADVFCHVRFVMRVVWRLVCWSDVEVILLGWFVTISRNLKLYETIPTTEQSYDDDISSLNGIWNYVIMITSSLGSVICVKIRSLCETDIIYCTQMTSTLCGDESSHPTLSITPHYQSNQTTLYMGKRGTIPHPLYEDEGTHSTFSLRGCCKSFPTLPVGLR